MTVRRIYVERKPEHAGAAAALLSDLREQLGLANLTGLRVLNRYDVEGLDEATFERVAPLVFFEPPLDDRRDACPAGDRVFAVEALPGQFDQRADSAAECIQLITQEQRPLVRVAQVYLLAGELSDADVQAVQAYVLNPVDSRLAGLDTAQTLHERYPEPAPVATVDGFTGLDEAGLAAFVRTQGLALDAADLAVAQTYFAGVHRDPTRTELAVLDAYWSDHCRHTTFGTSLDDVVIDDPGVAAQWRLFGAQRTRPGAPTLMEIATFGVKALALAGVPVRVDESEEINACTVPVQVDVDGQPQPWLLLFKNETHNHPTEIEPFGGAATCLGGAIRDPLSGRGIVYQAMRISGAADPTVPLSQTLPGKLPQRRLVRTAADGFSAYGNQVGLATGLVREVYHPGYVAKRFECGAVLAAVPAAQVRRERPAPGDVVLLIGGRTGRDGIGGASGSSRAHESASVASWGAQVQKGNAPTERKLRRLFANPAAARLIKRCNDFGAGGVCVAIGELADGLRIDLDAVPKKYEGLDGTELAVSESQERMAVVVDAADADAMIALARAENLEATPVAEVTEEPRLVMTWRGQTVVDLARVFLDANGARRHASVHVPELPPIDASPLARVGAASGVRERYEALLADLNVCSQQGLAERFDATIGAGTVVMPFGGARQRTPEQVMVATLPTGTPTDTCSGMACGFNPFWTERNPFQGAYLAVCDSIAKLVAAGFSRRDAYLTLQEYFPTLGDDPDRWGLPLAALLGALAAQRVLKVAAIGGKDSMSGSFEHLDVPPTLASFAVATGSASRVVAGEFVRPDARLVLVGTDPLIDPDGFVATLDAVERWSQQGAVLSAFACGAGGVAEAVFLGAIGNGIGAQITADPQHLFDAAPGHILLSVADDADLTGVPVAEVGRTTPEPVLLIGDERLGLAELEAIWDAPLAGVYPRHSARADEPAPEPVSSPTRPSARPHGVCAARPTAWIPVFPGTNCEDDTARAMERAGGAAQVQVLVTLTPDDVAASARLAAQNIARAQMVILPGGFSGGDEPDGSAKLIVSFLRHLAVAEALTALLDERDGLVLGICNGFQALIKLGLLPSGRILPATPDSPTLAANRIGRHQSMLVRTRIASTLSPWLAACQVGDVHTVAVSHGEGRFVASPQRYAALAAAGQVCAQYVDDHDRPTLCEPWNPNGSLGAVEALCSPDGRVLGKMGHTERSGPALYRNVAPGACQPLFESGVAYYR